MSYCGSNSFRGNDQKLSFGYDAVAMPLKFHKRDIKWTVRYVILKFTEEVQFRILLVEDTIAQNS